MCVLRTCILAAALFVLEVVSQEKEVVVNLKQGPITAVGQPAGDGRFVYAFQSIPYAKPPIGDLRFMAPVAADAWSEPRNGSQVSAACPQLDLASFLFEESKTLGDEDCLYLNVFTPRPFSSDLPVMVFIHGGGFVLGGIDVIQPLPLLTKDVVLVTLQYRLGVLGFLSMEDSLLPGNMGLKDQTLALKWVQDNIKELGGDPNKVTIFGESAGAASVDFHVLSPYSKGLFQHAILQSGNMLCPWALYDDHRGATLKMAEFLNCPSSDDVETQELLACIKDVPVGSLIKAAKSLTIWQNEPGVTLPRVDGDYLPQQPAEVLKKGEYNRVSLMAGINQDEGSIVVPFLLPNSKDIEALKENFTEIGPMALVFRKSDGNLEYLAKRIFYHYLGVAEFPMDNVDGYAELLGDRYFKKCHEDVSDMYARESVYGNNVYLYELQHRGVQTLIPMEGIGENWVGHGDDLQYLFNNMMPFKPLERGDDLFVSEIMVALWTNFATTGNPTPDLSLGFKWFPTTVTDRQYLVITTSPSMQKDTNADMREFWRNLPIKNNRILYPERFL